MNDWLKMEIFTLCLLATLLGAGVIAAFCFWLINRDKQEIEEENFKDYVKETLKRINENMAERVWKDTDEAMTKEEEEEEDKYLSSVLNNAHNDDKYKELLSQEEINKLHEI
jgi:uncharacterized membrane protein YraQ (UPF0718 family)